MACWLVHVKYFFFHSQEYKTRCYMCLRPKPFPTFTTGTDVSEKGKRIFLYCIRVDCRVSQFVLSVLLVALPVLSVQISIKVNSLNILRQDLEGHQYVSSYLYFSLSWAKIEHFKEWQSKSILHLAKKILLIVVVVVVVVIIWVNSEYRW